MSHYLQHARDPISSYTHFIGALLSVLGTGVLVAASISRQVGWMTGLSAAVFGLSLVALYATSATYHFVHGTDRVILRLRKLDHSMIYVLIAGSYTPMLLNLLQPPKSYLFTAVIWLCAVVGIAVKLFWFSAPRWFSTALYILMGWAIAFDLPSLGALPAGWIALLAAGGISYTICGVMYAVKKPNISADFGFHELFHLFVMLGSFLHFLVVFFYIL